MKVTKKENKKAFEALVFCSKAMLKKGDHRWRLDRVQIKRSRLIATDGSRLHYIRIKDIPNGLYDYEKHGNTITLTTVKDKYPNVDAVIPKRFFTKIKVDRLEFRDRLKQVVIMVDRRYQGMKMTFNGKLYLESINPDLGDVETFVHTNKQIAPELSLGINCEYVLEAIQGLKGEKITIGLQEKPETSPLMIMDKEKTALIMPMRL